MTFSVKCISTRKNLDSTPLKCKFVSKVWELKYKYGVQFEHYGPAVRHSIIGKKTLSIIDMFLSLFKLLKLLLAQ